MKKIIATLVALMLMAIAVVAVPSEGKPAFNGLNHPGQASQLMLYEKDSDWDIVDGGAWGRLTFGEDFVFNGHGLDKGVSYTLIRYTDPWSGSPVCLGEDVANGGGNVNIAGEFLDGGSKVWLVLSSDVDCDAPAMTGWNPSEYLFEYALI